MLSDVMMKDVPELDAEESWPAFSVAQKFVQVVVAGCCITTCPASMVSATPQWMFETRQWCVRKSMRIGRWQQFSDGP